MAHACSLCDVAITECSELGRRTTVVLVATAVLVVAVVATAVGLWQYTDAQVDRRTIEAIQDREGAASEGPDTPVDFLVVGSDDRSGLTRQQQVELSTGGDVGPVRTDVLLLVQLRPGASGASLVSVPRDLLVEHQGSKVKINSILARSGREGLVQAIEDLAGIQLDHYVEVSIPAFLTVVEAVGGVEVCLDAPLVDPDAGADLPAGCQQLDAEAALAFVRSREGGRGDFERIERQQLFLRALLDEVASTRTAVDLPRLFRVAGRLAGSLTTDEDLSLNQLRGLAQELEGVTSGDLGAATVPAYAVEDGLEPYPPGAEHLFSALRRAEDLPATGDPGERAAATVQLWHDGAPARAGHIESVLYFYGFRPRPVASGPVDPIGVEVFAEGDREVATWIANILGAEVRPLPEDANVDPEGVDALVGVGSGP